MKKLTKKQKEVVHKYILNLLKFTAPTLGVFFYQLSIGIDWKAAILVAALALWGALADYFKKFK